MADCAAEQFFKTGMSAQYMGNHCQATTYAHSGLQSDLKFDAGNAEHNF
jgi:hypothetical protein